jgi:hypothetical protein
LLRLPFGTSTTISTFIVPLSCVVPTGRSNVFQLPPFGS